MKMSGAEDTEPLLENGARTQKKQAQSHSTQSTCTCSGIVWAFFYLLCGLAGQYIYIKKPIKKFSLFLTVIGFILFVLQSLVYLACLGTTITIEFLTIDNFSTIANISPKVCSLPEEHWKFTTSITIGTIASFLSYFIITFAVLIPIRNGTNATGNATDTDTANVTDGDIANATDTDTANATDTDTANATDSDTTNATDTAIPATTNATDTAIPATTNATDTAIPATTNATDTAIPATTNATDTAIPVNDSESTKGCCCLTCRKVCKKSTLSPYSNEDSKLSNMEACSFLFNYLLVIILYAGAVISSILYAITVYRRDYCWINGLYFAMMVLHLSSHFSAIHSCFLFSKIVYKVTNGLDRLPEEMDNKHAESPVVSTTTSASPPSEEKLSRDYYDSLQKTDQDFLNKVKPTLKLVGCWFIFHWSMFGLTTVLNTAFIVQIIIDLIQYKVQSVDSFLPVIEADIKAPYILYVVFFTLVHAYLFLYPSFRAAAIANAREKLIGIVFKKKWKKLLLSHQSYFVQYLSSQNFALKVPLFCANISFGFNWVYVSFFISILGAYMRF